MQANIQPPLRIVIIGAGRAGSMLLRLLQGDPSVEVVGVAEVNPDAPGVALAREYRVPVSRNYRSFLDGAEVDILINVTGNAALQEALLREKPPGVEVIGGMSARLIWMLLDEYRQKQILQDTYDLMRRELDRLSEGEFLIGKTRKMQEIMQRIQRVAPTPTTVLIRGESGTGKELVARLIHQNSPWRNKPMITVNCTAFSASLIESELFGYKKGAFTGATQDKVGLLELAHQSTIFLDEVGDMPLEMQAKVLRFLQSGEIRAIGDTVTKRVKVRVIAATNRRLEDDIQAGKFRMDLFYRLNAFTIYMPPLRERRDDIPLFAYHFLKIAQAKVNKHVHKISPAAMAALVQYTWPGNLRELENVIEHAVVLTNTDEIDLPHLPLILQPDDFKALLPNEPLEGGLMRMKAAVVDRFEYEAVCRYLAENNGNVSRAARAAGVPRRTFQRLMAKHQIKAHAFKDKPFASSDDHFAPSSPDD